MPQFDPTRWRPVGRKGRGGIPSKWGKRFLLGWFVGIATTSLTSNDQRQQQKREQQIYARHRRHLDVREELVGGVTEVERFFSITPQW